MNRDPCQVHGSRARARAWRPPPRSAAFVLGLDLLLGGLNFEDECCQPSSVMSEPAPNPQLMPSLGRLARGLSALFWGLPTALIVCFHTAKAEGLKSFGILPPLMATGLLVYGLWQLGAFQRQERIWRLALDRAMVLSLINFGLSPFLYWWNRVPASPFFMVMVMVLTVSGVLFLSSLNVVLQRLGAMLPEEALRQEIKQFTPLNLNLLFTTLIFQLAYMVLMRFEKVPLWLGMILAVMEKGSTWFLILLVLLPLAMTMALLWKTKEVILDGVFGAGS
jgi:hypothetical protein